MSYSVNTITTGLIGPNGICVDKSGNIYIAESSTVKQLTPSGSSWASSTIASGISTYGICVNDPGTIVYASDIGGHVVRKITKIDTTWNTTVFAGISGTFGHTDNPIGTSALLNGPAGLSLDNSGNIYVAEYTGNYIRKITPSGAVSTYAGNGVFALTDSTTLTSASFKSPVGIFVDRTLNIIYTTETGTGSNALRSITSLSGVTTISGGLSNPTNVCVDNRSNVYVTQYNSNNILKFTKSGSTWSGTVFAGTGTAGSTDTTAASSLFNNPHTIVPANNFSNGLFYVSEYNGGRIRSIYVQAPTYNSPYTNTNTTYLMPKYTNISGGTIGITGTASATLNVASSLSLTNYNASGSLSSSGLGYINYFGLAVDGPFNFTAFTTIGTIDSSPANVYLFYKATQPNYPKLTITGNTTIYSLSSTPIAIFSRIMTVSLTLSGDKNVIYSLTHPQGGVFYDISNVDVSSSGVITKSLSLMTGIVYTVSVTDYAGNSIQSNFIPYILAPSYTAKLDISTSIVNSVDFADMDNSGNLIYLYNKIVYKYSINRNANGIITSKDTTTILADLTTNYNAWGLKVGLANTNTANFIFVSNGGLVIYFPPDYTTSYTYTAAGTNLNGIAIDKTSTATNTYLYYPSGDRMRCINITGTGVTAANISTRISFSNQCIVSTTNGPQQLEWVNTSFIVGQYYGANAGASTTLTFYPINKGTSYIANYYPIAMTNSGQFQGGWPWDLLYMNNILYVTSGGGNGNIVGQPIYLNMLTISGTSTNPILEYTPNSYITLSGYRLSEYAGSVYSYNTSYNNSIFYMASKSVSADVPTLFQYTVSQYVPFPILSISGSTNPNATINANSGQILYTNASDGLLNIRINEASYTILYDLSFAGQNPSGSFIGVSGTTVPFTNLTGTTPSNVTSFTWIVPRRVLTHAPPPKTRMFYPSSSSLIAHKRYCITKRCSNKNQVVICPCVDSSNSSIEPSIEPSVVPHIESSIEPHIEPSVETSNLSYAPPPKTRTFYPSSSSLTDYNMCDTMCDN